MDFDEDKIDDYTLALLYLVTHERHEGSGARAWKGFDWDTLNNAKLFEHEPARNAGKMPALPLEEAVTDYYSEMKVEGGRHV